jgi:hypothetical protein
MVDPRWEAYQVGAGRCMGLDLKRSQYIDDFGNYDANTAAVFRAGQLVQLNAAQEVILDVGAVSPFGVAKFDKTTSRYATVVGEYIQLNGLAATPLAHANLFAAAGGVASGAIRVAAALTGAAYTQDTDYSVNYVNGTITDLGVGIVLNSYVYVNYQYALTAVDELREGRNFWLSTDDVTIQDERVTVITGRATLFTSQYDQSQTYSVNDALYSGAAADSLSGYFTKRVTSTFVVGKVFQIPTADDPFLGVTFTG